MVCKECKAYSGHLLLAQSIIILRSMYSTDVTHSYILKIVDWRKKERNLLDTGIDTWKRPCAQSIHRIVIMYAVLDYNLPFKHEKQSLKLGCTNSYSLTGQKHFECPDAYALKHVDCRPRCICIGYYTALPPIKVAETHILRRLLRLESMNETLPGSCETRDYISMTCQSLMKYSFPIQKRYGSSDRFLFHVSKDTV